MPGRRGRKEDRTTGAEKRGDARGGWASRFGVDTGLFFLLFYLYVWLLIDPRLIHHAIGIITPYFSFSFTTGWPLLREHLAMPGGMVEYATRLLTAFYAVGWLGALIVTAAAWATCLGVDVVTRLGGQPRGMVLRYGPAVLMLATYGGDGYPMRGVLSLLAALFCFVLYLRLTARGGTAKASARLAFLSVVAYYVGGVDSLLFAVLAAIYEAFFTRRKLVSLTALLCGLGLPWLMGRTLFGLTLAEAHGGCLSPESGESAAWTWRYILILYLYLPAVLAGVALHRFLLTRKASMAANPTPSETGSSSAPGVPGFLSWGESRWSMKVVAVCLLAGTIAWFTFDTGGRPGLEMDYYCQHEMWPEVLEAADRMPRGLYNIRCNRNLMLALYHTGRLGDDLFRYPQAMGDVFYVWISSDKSPHTCLQESRLFLGLGQVNSAQKCAYEALVTIGDLPWILKQLATIHIVKDEPETATMLLHALSKKPLHRRTAEEMLQRLAEDPRLANDAKVQQIRQFMVRRDTISITVSSEECLLALLEENSGNKMAFEFLMAHYLRTGHPDKIVENLEQLKRFGYSGIPRHFQEAIIVHASRTGRQIRRTDGQVMSENLMRAEVFSDILASASSREEAMQTAVEVGLGDSLFFYYEFGVSGR